MIIKKEPIKKKNKFISFTKFLYFYFIVTIVVIFLFVVAIYQSYFFSKEKNKLLDYISKAGRYEYLYLPQIAFKAIKGKFYKLGFKRGTNTDRPISKNIILRSRFPSLTIKFFI